MRRIAQINFKAFSSFCFNSKFFLQITVVFMCEYVGVCMCVLSLAEIFQELNILRVLRVLHPILMCTGVFPHTKDFSDTSWIQLRELNWIPRDNFRSHRLRAQFYKTAPSSHTTTTHTHTSDTNHKFRLSLVFLTYQL